MHAQRVVELLGKHLDDELETSKELIRILRKVDEALVGRQYKLRSLIKVIEKELADEDVAAAIEAPL